MEALARLPRYKLHLARATTDHLRIDVDLAQRTLISSARLRHGVIVDGRGCWPSSDPGSVKNSRDLSRITTRSSQHAAGRVLIAGRRQRVARSRFDRFHRLSRTHRARARAPARIRVPFAAPVASARFRHELRSLHPEGEKKREGERESRGRRHDINRSSENRLVGHAVAVLRAFPFSTTIPAS